MKYDRLVADCLSRYEGALKREGFLWGIRSPYVEPRQRVQRLQLFDIVIPQRFAFLYRRDGRLGENCFHEYLLDVGCDYEENTRNVPVVNGAQVGAKHGRV